MRRLTVLSGSARALAAAALLFWAAPLGAQSLLASQGLGLVVTPMSARSAALGGVSLGLPGAELSWSNPAGASGLQVPGLVATLQYDSFDSSLGDRTLGNGSTARFPLVFAAFPFGERWALTAGFGGFLDQRWSAQEPDSIILGSDTTRVLDVVSSDGGVSRLRVAAAYRVVPSLSVSVGTDVYTGGTRRVAGRIFPGETAPRCCTTDWQYSGLGLIGSVDWNPNAALSVAASAGFGGTLHAETRDTTSEEREYDVPVTARVGATARVSANTLLALSADWGGWSGLDPRLAGTGGARDTWGVGGGLEWDAVRFGGRPLPLRLGGRYTRLPFGSAATGSFPSERAVSLGTGLNLAGGAARGDLAVERGSRDAGSGGVSESFWRIVFSASILGQ